MASRPQALPDARRQLVETALAALVTALRPRQSGILGARGRYHQLLPGAWDRWQEFEPDRTNVAAVWIDEYLSGQTQPPTPGYVVVAQVTLAGNEVWQRRVHVTGPEAWQESGWTQVTEGQ